MIQEINTEGGRKICLSSNYPGCFSILDSETSSYGAVHKIGSTDIGKSVWKNYNDHSSVIIAII